MGVTANVVDVVAPVMFVVAVSSAMLIVIVDVTVVGS